MGKTNNYLVMWSRSESVGSHRDHVWGEVGCGDTRTGGQGLGAGVGQFVFGWIGLERDCWLWSGWVGVEWGAVQMLAFSECAAYGFGSFSVHCHLIGGAYRPGGEGM